MGMPHELLPAGTIDGMTPITIELDRNGQDIEVHSLCMYHAQYRTRGRYGCGGEVSPAFAYAPCTEQPTYSTVTWVTLSGWGCDMDGTYEVAGCGGKFINENDVTDWGVLNGRGYMFSAGENVADGHYIAMINMAVTPRWGTPYLPAGPNQYVQFWHDNGTSPYQFDVEYDMTLTVDEWPECGDGTKTASFRFELV